MLVQLALFAVPATVAWRSSLDRTVWIPVVAIAAAMLIGVVLLLTRSGRSAGGRIIVGSLAAAALEASLVLCLVMAYSAANPGWDLS